MSNAPMKDEFEWCDEFDGFIQPVGETNQFKFKAALMRGLFYTGTLV
ncbi:hypothetical protein KKJ06_21710 [Xenorhabdus bovienii]|nr:hypothetical protein [Xenorhabdus bovienii]